jgi:preprotein translocase subunit SecF
MTVLWSVISAVIIIAGIVLYILMGFNFAADKPTSYKFEVTYDTVVTVGENAEEDLAKACEDAFAANGISYSEKQTYDITGGGILEYTFAGTVDSAKLKTVEGKLETEFLKQGVYADADVSVSVHSLEQVVFTEAQWRGAIALAVGAIVALAYIAIRFGLPTAISGLIGAVHSAFLTLAVLVVARVPIYGYAPILFAAIATLLAVLLWTVIGAKMRENFKSPEFNGVSAEEGVSASVSMASKGVLAIAVVIAVAFALLGGLATSGVMAFFLPALIPVLVVTYSSLVFTPAVHAQIKASFDRAAAKRKRYDYKKSESENA